MVSNKRIIALNNNNNNNNNGKISGIWTSTKWLLLLLLLLLLFYVNNMFSLAGATQGSFLVIYPKDVSKIQLNIWMINIRNQLRTGELKKTTHFNISRDDPLLISTGNLFQKVSAATINAQLLYDLSRDTGTCNNIWIDDLEFRDGITIDVISHIYSGASLLIDL